MAVTFAANPPTVDLLVDRSGSMFHCLNGNTGDTVCSDVTNTNWYRLKSTVESVTAQLDSRVRFGFATIWGTNPAAGGTCPSLEGEATNSVPPVLGNASAIMAVYDGLTLPPNSTQSGMTFKGPASAAIGVAARTLKADATPGSKNIVLVTDGQPDYCDDTNSLCPPDSVVYQLQAAYGAGIRTIVVGFQTPLFDLAPTVLQAFANAGAGEPTLAPFRAGGSIYDFFDQCSGISSWNDDLTMASKPKTRGSTVGTYGVTMGPAVPYSPDNVGEVTAAISALKECTFHVVPVNGRAIRIDRTRISTARVCFSKDCSTGEVPQDAAAGWSMVSDTELLLNGAACEQWRSPGASEIAFDFPCGSVLAN